MNQLSVYRPILHRWQRTCYKTDKSARTNLAEEDLPECQCSFKVNRGTTESHGVFSPSTPGKVKSAKQRNLFCI